MDKCECYIEDRQLVDYTPLMKPLYKTVTLCFGTKERDQCSCNGDRTKCDFYPEVREKGRESVGIQDAINHFEYGIKHDIFQEPVTTYAKLAVKALKRQIKEK